MQTATASAVALAALSVGLAIGVFAAPARDPAVEAARCPGDSTAMSRLDLVFGAGRKAEAPVSDAQWAVFLDEDVTPRFPHGLTVLTGSGQWREAGGGLVKETTRVLLVWYTPSASTSGDIDAIRVAYKSRFGQDSVMRVDDRTACVAF